MRSVKRSVLMRLVALGCTLFLLEGGFAQAQNGVRITDPARDSYVSGDYTVVLEYDDTTRVTHTRLYLDDILAFDKPGWHPGVMLNFGEEILPHKIYAKLTLDDGQEVLSPTVQTRRLEINVTATSEVVLLTAVVKTRRNKTITGLSQDQFTVRENGIPLEINTFYNERLPLDLVFLVDSSSSLKVKGIATVKAAALAFIEQLEPVDRICLYEFKSEPVKVMDFTNDRKRVLNHIKNIEPLGETALYDTLNLGLKDLQGRRRGRKAVVLFTDGRDSRYDEPSAKAQLLRQAISTAQNQEVALFTIGLGNRVHQEAMERMALETGGRFHFAKGASDLHEIFQEIVADLKHQYVLGVVPQSSGSGFKRIDISVKKRGAQVYARKGYSRP